MSEYDWERIGLLLMVAEKLALHPKLKNLTAAVNAELDAIANPPLEEEEGEETEEQIGDPGAPPDPSSSTDGNDPDEQKETKHERRA